MSVYGAIRTVERINHIAQASQRAHQEQAETHGTPPPAAADCSAEAARLNGLTEEELQQVGQQYLEEACQFISRFSVLPSRAATYALATFAASTWIYRQFTETPRIHVTAMTSGAGKTRVMKLTNLLCANPQMMAKITGPALYHIIPERHPAPLGLDEADAIFGQGQRAEDLRGILNAGYEESGAITRVVGGTATDFNVFCPVMFAGIGELPTTLKDRSISIMMTKRKRAKEEMDRYNKRLHEGMGRKIGLMLGAWTTKIQGPAGDIIWDDAPEGLEDRQVDILTPLYAICQMAGGPWPERFDEIVDVLMLGGVSTDEVSPATALLNRIREVWPEGVERLATHALAALVVDPESQDFNWSEEVATGELNARMRGLGIDPAPMRIAGKVMRGYERETILGPEDVTEDDGEDSVTGDDVTPLTSGNTVTADGEIRDDLDEPIDTRPLPVSHDQLDGMARRSNGRKRTKSSEEE